MPRIAYLVSSAREIDLRDSGAHPVGYWAEQALTSYDRFVAHGADVVVLTPDGKAPVIEPYSLEPHFHFPAEDRGYLASVCRTFHRHPDRIRVTLHHRTELGLVAARRIARRLEVAGRSAAEAHEVVSRAAKIAWRQDRGLVDVMLAEGVDGGLTEASLRQAVEELAVVSAAEAEDRKGRLDDLDAFREPVALAGLTDRDLGEFDALFAPGGHGALVDLPESAAVSRLLRVLHGKGATIATLGHAAALLLAAPDRLDGHWLFEGFRLTCPTNEEEDQSAFGLPWYVASALQNAGAVLDDGAPWASHVVVDRNLITGQNPYSTEATVGAIGKALGLA